MKEEVKEALKEILAHELKNNGEIDLQACLSKIFSEDDMKLLGFAIKNSPSAANTKTIA